MNFRYAAVAALTLAAAGTMSALTAGPQNYTYDLTLPTIADGVERIPGCSSLRPLQRIAQPRRHRMAARKW